MTAEKLCRRSGRKSACGIIFRQKREGSLVSTNENGRLVPRKQATNQKGDLLQTEERERGDLHVRTYVR